MVRKKCIHFPTTNKATRMNSRAVIPQMILRQVRDHINATIFAQDMREWNAMIPFVKGARSILEIGSRFGESVYHMAKEMQPPGKVVVVDLPCADDVQFDPEPSLRDRANDICKMGFDFHGFLANSRDPEVIARVAEHGPYDFIFIDGDHTYKGVKADWENYGHMGKIVAFHDIAGQPGCYRLWEELHQEYRTVEFTHSRDGNVNNGVWMGIGVLFREEKEDKHKQWQAIRKEMELARIGQFRDAA